LVCDFPSHKWLGYFRGYLYFEIIMHSFNSCLVHCVFSTKERRPWLTPAMRERLWPYLGGIARENGMKAHAHPATGVFTPFEYRNDSNKKRVASSRKPWWLDISSGWIFYCRPDGVFRIKSPRRFNSLDIGRLNTHN
jgi:hypothetical protein